MHLWLQKHSANLFLLITVTTLYIESLTCEELSPPDNGEISLALGPNSLSHGLGSVATYSCDPGYTLVGETTRTCEDTNGGTVTTGTWSGTPPHCQGISCVYEHLMHLIPYTPFHSTVHSLFQ